MSQKFISLDDASARLGVSKDRLNQLREAGDLRAYRDGASWKFRTEEIEKLEADGVPSDDNASGDDYSMATGSDLGLASLDDGPPTPDPTASVEELEAADGEGDDLDIGLGIEPLGDGDDAESILLTGDQDLEGGIPRPQSTIIGKSELSLDDDLELASSSDVAPAIPAPPAADSGSFDGIEELELDLESASSPKLDSGSDAETPAKPEAPAAADSGEFELEELELDLAGSDTNVESKSGSDILGDVDLDSESPSLSGLGSVTGLSGIDSIDLAADEDDDMVLGGSDDSGDLAAGDSGINLSPSDSGFALDEVPLDLGGSAIGSQLDLASLSAAGSDASGPAISGLGGEDFQLTPADSGEDDEDSSQIVALDDISEEEDEDIGGFEPDEEVDFEGGFDGGIGTEAGAAPVGSVAVQEVPFPGWIIGLLSAGFFSMLLGGLMALELLQSMWSWSEPYSFNSTVMDGILGIFGIQ